jgi:hypothetical protein
VLTDYREAQKIVSQNLSQKIGGLGYYEQRDRGFIRLLHSWSFAGECFAFGDGHC